MAEKAKEEEVDYESDPEETKLSLKMRRREASDDEEEGEGREEKMKPNRRMVESDVDSDSQGAAAEYDDEELEDEDYVEEEELIEEDEECVEEEMEYEERGVEAGSLVDAEGGKHRGEGGLGVEDLDGQQDLSKDQINDKRLTDDPNGEEEEGVVEKKENEPYAVPTAGAFYMHDDRFRDNAGGRNRRTFGGRKLWESKDEKKWGHDKFEELTVQERRYDEGRRNFRGRYRGRGRARGPERGYAQGNSPRGYNIINNPNKNAIHSNVPRSIRGQGQRRYQQSSFTSNSEAPSSRHQQPGKPAERSSYSVSAKTSISQSNVEPESAPARKNTFGSSLNSASPPFYPSGSSSKDVPLTQKGDAHPVTTNRSVHPSFADQSFSMIHPAPVQRGKAVVDSMGMDKLYIGDSLSAVAEKPSGPLQSAVSSSTLTSSQSLQLRGQGRGINSLPQMAYQPTGSASQVSRFPPPASHPTMQRNQVPGRGHSTGQHFGQSSRGGSQGSPPKASDDKSSSEPAEVESPSESMNSKTSLVSKGKSNIQSTGRASLLYGGAQAMGSPGNLGDQNFPAFLPVMQFGGQHPGGVGVPAVGMAFPGYVGQPKLGGNSEMTWLPVLAGAAGALGAAYGSPYIAIDGAYHGRPSGQASSLPPAIKESNGNKPNNDLNPPQRLEVSNDDFGHRQKNPRRYTEMKFDH